MSCPGPAGSGRGLIRPPFRARSRSRAYRCWESGPWSIETIPEIETPGDLGDEIGAYRYGPDGQATNSGVGVFQIKDDKVLNQWVYPAE